MPRRVALLLAFVAGAVAVVVAIVVVDALDQPEPPPGARVATVPALLATDEAVRRTTDVYAGLGTWVDVFDFDPAYQNGAEPAVDVTDVDAMADSGVRTLYLQAARLDARTPEGIADKAALGELLVRAHQHGIRVVGWYLPRFGDIEADLDRLELVRDFDVLGHRFDGVAVDIEYARDVPDHVVRGQRLVELSRRFAEVSGDEAVGAIVLPPVQLEVINPQLWPEMPYRQLAPHYDVWLPMAYWTFRTEQSGYHDGLTYAEESIRRLRRNLGDPEAPVHPIGGIGDLVVADDLRRFATAADQTGSLGASIYDWSTLDDANRALLADLFAP